MPFSLQYFVQDGCFNDTHLKKTVLLNLVQERLLLTFFHMFTQSIKLYTFHYHILKSTDV